MLFRSKYADIGISFPGSGEGLSIPVYQDGKLLKVLKGEDVKNQFIEILNTYIHNRFTKQSEPVATA